MRLPALSITHNIPKRFQRGLVVGKFSPLHKGHEAVIRRAFELCREVVLISYCNPEFSGCEAKCREKWLAELFPGARRLVVTKEGLAGLLCNSNQPISIPRNEEPDFVHRRFVGQLCYEGLGITVDAVFTSEVYGDGFAHELTAYFRERIPSALEVRHVLVDLDRREFPISGTAIRSDLEKNRMWLSPIVYASFVRRVCILGGESSGKSTLAEGLARRFGTVHVPEYGRELWERKNGALDFGDLLDIAQTQVTREEEACLRANQFLFCDTAPLTTLFYSSHLFQRAERRLEELADRHYDLTVLCAPDFEFVQDGTRQDSNFRERQNRWYVRELARRGVPWLEVGGSIEQRIATVSRCLRAL